MTDQKPLALSNFTDYKKEEVQLIKATVAKNTTNTELAYFLQIAKNYKLDPFKKEIWCFKDNRNNLLCFAGRDGFRSIAQRDAKFVSSNSMEVYEDDTFQMGANEDGEMTVEHKTNGRGGVIIGAYAIVKLSTGGKVVEWADIKTYDKSNPKFMSPWQTHKAEMIKKVAETHALKKAFGINGLFCEEEFQIDKSNGVVVDVENEEQAEYKKEIDAIDNIEDLVVYFHKNKGKGKEFDKYIAERKNQLIPEVEVAE